jgi:hypothetical protein
MLLAGLDLNFEPLICHPAMNHFAGVIDAYGQAGVCAVDGASAADDFSSLCGALRWRSQGQAIHLFGSIPVDGLCAIDLSRESQRYRGVSWRAVLQALSLGFSQQHGGAQYLGERQRNSGLAHLLRIRTASDRDGAKALCQRTFWSRSERYCLRSRCDHYRSVPVGVPVGPVSFDQSGYQAAYALGFERQYPSFIHISDGKWHEVNLLDELIAEPGAFYVMDRGYIDFERLFRLSDAGSFFVTRAKSNLKVQRRYSRKVDKSTGLICDQTVVLTVFYSRKGFDAPLRRVKFKDPETGKNMVFLTNNFVLPALTITQLYRLRWRIELFFKWIKQHLRIKAFFGTTENAVKTQIWIAISIYVLVAIIKKRLNLSASLYELLQILSLTLFERVPLIQLLAESHSATELLEVHKQLNLFN